MPSESVAVCVLLYGDYKNLAVRCIESIRRAKWHDSVNIVIGMNAVCDQTREYIYDLYGNYARATVFDSQQNIRKYPMMRHMFYDNECGALKSDVVMWFDDDSYLKPGGLSQQAGWLDACCNDLRTRGDMFGSKYTRLWQGQQKQWVRRQLWFNPSVSMDTEKLSFITGGWWFANSSMIRAADYPWRSLSHNGGDSMFGEMCRHVGYRQVAYTGNDVAINADAGGAESKATRRGVSEPEIGKYDTAGTVAAATTPAGTRAVRTIGDSGLFG